MLVTRVRLPACAYLLHALGVCTLAHTNYVEHVGAQTLVQIPVVDFLALAMCGCQFWVSNANILLAECKHLAT